MPRSEMRYYSQGELEKFREECPPQFIGRFECVLEDLEAMRSERDQLLNLVNGVGRIHDRAVNTLREDLRVAWDKVRDFMAWG